MMNLTEILKEASHRHITLWVEDGQLRFRAPAGALNDEFRTVLVSNKAALIKGWPWGAMGHDKKSGLDPRPAVVQIPAYLHGLWCSVLRRDLDVSYTNIIHNVLRCRRQFDLDILDHALSQLIKRHPVLSARIENADGGPAITLNACDVELQRHDLSHIDESRREETAKSLASELVWHPFQPELGPMISAFAIKLGEDDFIIGFVLHHLVSDLVSVRIFTFEWMQAYECLLRGIEILLPPPSMTYEDYLRNMDAWISAEGAHDLVEYWRQNQSNAPATLLPANPNQEGVSTDKIVCLKVKIDEETARLARLFAANNGVTLFQVLLGAMAYALAEITGQSDISIMFTAICRDDPKSMGTIGSLLNIVHFRMLVVHDETAVTLIKKVRVAYAGAVKHQLCPYELVRQVRAEVGGCADMPYAPHFNFVDIAPGTKKNLDQKVAELSPISQFDIGANPAARVRGTEFCSFYSPFTAHEHGIDGSIQYSPVLCAKDVVEQYVSRFRAAVTRFAMQAKV